MFCFTSSDQCRPDQRLLSSVGAIPVQYPIDEHHSVHQATVGMISERTWDLTSLTGQMSYFLQRVRPWFYTTYNVNKLGLSTVPSGTPKVKRCACDIDLKKQAFCLRLDKYDSNQYCI